MTHVPRSLVVILALIIAPSILFAAPDPAPETADTPPGEPAAPPADAAAPQPVAPPAASAPQADNPPAGPGTPSVEAPAPAPKKGRNIGGPGDHGLRSRLLQSMSTDPDLNRTGVKIVLVNGGVVYSGKMPHWTARRRALVLAGATRGIVNVTDQMEISRGDVPDSAIIKEMTGILKEHREPLGIKDLDVTVSDGVATLLGTVRDFAARVRAEEVSGRVLGVTRIVNRLRPLNAPAGTDDTTTRKAIGKYLGAPLAVPFRGQCRVTVRGGR